MITGRYMSVLSIPMLGMVVFLVCRFTGHDIRYSVIATVLTIAAGFILSMLLAVLINVCGYFEAKKSISSMCTFFPIENTCLTDVQEKVARQVLSGLIEALEAVIKDNWTENSDVLPILTNTLDKVNSKELSSDNMDLLNSIIALPSLYSGFISRWWQAPWIDVLYAKVKYKTIDLSPQDTRCTLHALEKMPFLTSYTLGKEQCSCIVVRLPDSGYIFSAKRTPNEQLLILRGKKGQLISHTNHTLGSTPFNAEGKKIALNKHLLSKQEDHLNLLINLGLL